MRHAVALLFVGFTLAHGADDATWKALEKLSGDWVGEGTGKPGEATGGFLFSSELQGKIITRKNWADYPKQNDKPAFRHDDFTVISRSENGPIQATYWDNEGHVIHYTVSTSTNAQEIVFLGDVPQEGPRFRFRYFLQNDKRMKMMFEIASPGKPTQFSTYIEATARRRQ